MQVRELVTRLGFDADLSGAQRYDRAVNNLRQAASRLVAVVGAARVSLSVMGHQVAQTGDELNRSALKAGTAAEGYQELVFALERMTGVSGRQIQGSLEGLNSRLIEAQREGGSAAKAFVQIGLTSRELREGSVSTADAMAALSSRLRETESDAKAAGIASDVLGGEIGQVLGPIIRNSDQSLDQMVSRFRELGGVMDRDAIDNSVEYRAALLDLQTVVFGLWREVGSNLIPQLTETVNGFTEWAAANRDLIARRVNKWVRSLVDGLAGVRDFLGIIVDGFGSLINVMGGLNNAVRIAMTSFGLLLAFRTVRSIINVAVAVGGLTGAVSLLSKTLWAIPIVAVIGLLIAFLDDLYLWINHNQGALHDWLGDWQDFKDRINTQVIQPLENIFGGLAQMIRGALTLNWSDVVGGWNTFAGQLQEWASILAERVAKSFREDFLGALTVGALDFFGVETPGLSSGSFSPRSSSPEQDVGSAMGASRDLGASSNRQLNVTVNPQLNVPQGMSQTERQQWLQETEQIFDRLMTREVMRAERDLGPTE